MPYAAAFRFGDPVTNLTVIAVGSNLARFALFTSAAAILIASRLPCAVAVEVLDQQNDFESSIGDTAGSLSQELGQTFTVGVAGTLTRIEVKLARFSFTGDDVILRVTDSTGVFPDNNYGSVSVNSGMVSTTAPTFVSFDVSSFAIPVNVNDKLAFVMSSSAGGTYVLPYPLTETYPGGSAVRRTASDPPGPWEIQTGRDYAFKTYVEQALEIAGDFNKNGRVDAADYALWRHGLGTTYTPEDYDVWRTNFNAPSNDGSGNAAIANPVPEPTTLPLMAVVSVLLTTRRRWPKSDAIQIAANPYDESRQGKW